MKVIALIQFYLDYVLPRADDWDGPQVPFQLQEFVVTVHPRSPDEDLFPHEIDRTLSTMSLSLVRLNLPTGRTRLLVSDRCHDRVEVRVEGRISESELVRSSEAQSTFLQTAVKCCNVFLNHCRVTSRSPFVHGIERHYKPEEHRYYILTPHTISWFDGESGEPLAIYEGGVNASASSGALLSPERGGVSIAQVAASLKAGIDPNLPLSFLLDAEEMLRTERIREATVSMAMSCEVAANEFLRRHSKLDDPQAKKILKSRASFAAKYFDRICTIVASKSLKVDDRETFKLVENLYRARNNVVHQGRCYYRSDSGAEITVDEKLISKFLQATETTLDWLKQL